MIEHEIIEATYRRFAPELRRLLVRRLGEMAADDALQITFVKFAEQGDSVQPAAVKAWLYRVAINQANGFDRRAGVEHRARNRLASERPRHVASAESILQEAERVEWVRSLLERLPAHQREIVYLKFYEGKTFAQIARQLETPLGTVLSRMQSALKQLRRIASDWDPSPDPSTPKP